MTQPNEHGHHYDIPVDRWEEAMPIPFSKNNLGEVAYTPAPHDLLVDRYVRGGEPHGPAYSRDKPAGMVPPRRLITRIPSGKIEFARRKGSGTIASTMQTGCGRIAASQKKPMRRQEACRCGGSGLPALCAWVARRYASAMRVRYVAAAMGMAIAIPFMAPVPAYADEPVFSDNFATKNTTLWYYGAGASVSDDQLYLANSTSFDGYIVAVHSYNFTDCAFAALEVTPPSISDGIYTEAEIVLSIDQDNSGHGSLYFGPVEGYLRVEYWIGGSADSDLSILYQGTTLVPDNTWLRIRHSSATGLIYYETSTNGTTWTAVYSAASPVEITSLYPLFTTGIFQSPTSSPPTVFSNASLVHNAPVSPPPPP